MLLAKQPVAALAAIAAIATCSGYCKASTRYAISATCYAISARHLAACVALRLLLLLVSAACGLAAYGLRLVASYSSLTAYCLLLAALRYCKAACGYLQPCSKEISAIA